MARHHTPTINGDEQDALSHRAKGFYHWQPGERKRIKRQFNRRERQALNRAGLAGW